MPRRTVGPGGSADAATPAGKAAVAAQVVAAGAAVSFIVEGYTPGRFTMTKMAEFPCLGDAAEPLSVAYEKVARKHPEFIATHTVTKEIVAVEAKSRHRPGVLGFGQGDTGKSDFVRAGLTGLLRSALQKRPQLQLENHSPGNDSGIPPAEWATGAAADEEYAENIISLRACKQPVKPRSALMTPNYRPTNEQDSAVPDSHLGR